MYITTFTHTCNNLQSIPLFLLTSYTFTKGHGHNDPVYLRMSVNRRGSESSELTVIALPSLAKAYYELLTLVVCSTAKTLVELFLQPTSVGVHIYYHLHFTQSFVTSWAQIQAYWIAISAGSQQLLDMYILANKHPCSHVVYIVTRLDLEHQTNVIKKNIWTKKE